MPNFEATSCHVFSPISGNCEPTWFISLRRLSRHSRASPLEVRGIACVCSIRRRIAEYQSAARTCWSARCANPKKAWIPAKTAASRLIVPTTILSPDRERVLAQGGEEAGADRGGEDDDGQAELAMVLTKALGDPVVADLRCPCAQPPVLEDLLEVVVPFDRRRVRRFDRLLHRTDHHGRHAPFLPESAQKRTRCARPRPRCLEGQPAYSDVPAAAAPGCRMGR